MPEAHSRNSVPEKFLLPNLPMEQEGIVAHEVMASEDNNFECYQNIISVNSNSRYWSLSFQKKDELLEVAFRYSYGAHGQPKRSSYQILFNLEPGQYGSFKINGRFTYYSGQFYRQQIVHVAHKPTNGPELFLKHEPIKVVSKLAHLF